jgi:hypothetical protein
MTFPRETAVRWVSRAGVAAWLLAIGGVAAAADAGERPVPRIGPGAGKPETLSSSGQFLAHGPERADRSVLVSRAERVRDEFIALFDRDQARPELNTPPGQRPARPLTIHLWLQGDAQPEVQPRVYRVQGTSEPTLGLVVGRAGLAGSDRFRREVVRLLLADRILRVHPEADMRPGAEVVPSWLFTGAVEALDHLRLGAPAARFQRQVEAGRILSIDDILNARADKLDAASREAFAASACSLVIALLEQPQGPSRLRAFLGEIPVHSEPPQVQLVRSFPGLALSNHSLEKWWSLQLAQMAQPTAFEPFDAAETERRLAAALMVHLQPEPERPAGTSTLGRWLKGLIPGGKPAGGAASPAPPAAAPESASARQEEVIPLEDLDRLAALKQRKSVLTANQSELSVLALRAFPLHRPLLDEYQQIIGLIIRGKTKGVAARLDSLAARRRDILTAVENVEDHLNWYQATQRPGASGSFDRYFRLLDELGEPPPKSDDPITRYLDGIEQEFENR